MLVAVAPPTPLVTPLKRRGGRGEAPRQQRFASPVTWATGAHSGRGRTPTGVEKAPCYALDDRRAQWPR
eukprot:6462763-Pyramimonas_sp.AAC.1